MNNVNLRLSNADDELNIRVLIHKCFGSVDVEEAVKDIVGRYVVAVLDNRVIAITGLKFNNDYSKFELDYTCTDPEYRGKGIMRKLFSRLMYITDEEIYCSARVINSENNDMIQILKSFGFKLALKDRVKYSSKFNCKKALREGGCTHNNCYKSCECSEDLYIRDNRFDN